MGDNDGAFTADEAARMLVAIYGHPRWKPTGLEAQALLVARKFLGYRVALRRIAESRDAGRHDGLREECPLHDQYTMWLEARGVLSASPLADATEDVCEICGAPNGRDGHEHRSDGSGLDDGPPLRTKRKKPAPKTTEEMREIRSRAWATRRGKYGDRGHS